LGKDNRKLTSKRIAKTIKEINFNSKLQNGNLEELSNIFRDRLGRLYEIEPVMMPYVNPLSTLGLNFVAKDIGAIYETNVVKAIITNFGTTGQLNLKDKNFWKLLYYSITTVKNSAIDAQQHVGSTCFCEQRLSIMNMYKNTELAFLILNLVALLRAGMSNHEAEFKKITSKM